MCRVYSLMIQDLNGSEQTWLISQMLGFQDLPGHDQNLSSATGLKKPLPRGGVAALIDENRMHPSLPQYKAYYLLPLPIHMELPVHVNGMFELDSSRKNLLKGDDYATVVHADANDSLIHRWNRQLITYVIAPAYAELILEAGRKILDGTDDEGSMQYEDKIALYDKLFPKDLEKLHGEWRLLAKETLCFIGKKNFQVLPVVHTKDKVGDIHVTWHHPSSVTSMAFFNGLGMKSTIMRSFLLEVGFNLLASSPKLCKAFQACDVNAEFVSPQVVVRHMSSESLIAPCLPAPLEETAFKCMNTFQTVFKYCLDGITRPLELNGLPFRLTNDGILSQFTTNVGLYVTSHWNVLPCLQEMFLQTDLVKCCTKLV